MKTFNIKYDPLMKAMLRMELDDEEGNLDDEEVDFDRFQVQKYLEHVENASVSGSIPLFPDAMKFNLDED
ncbi:MAG: hypothetical protein GY765_28410 [bacterium]|nr:hypothetical protein [bacterium]